MTSIRDTRPLVPGSLPGGRGGWVKPLDQQVAQLEAEITGLEERLKNGLRGGQPTVYSAKREFLAENEVVDGAQFNLAYPLNYVVRDAVTYDVPVQFPGPGVFLARRLTVSVQQRIWVPQYAHEVWVTMSSMDTPALGQSMNPTRIAPVANFYVLDGVRIDSTYKASVFPTLPSLPSTTLLGSRNLKAGINYFWNLQDSKSGRWIADDLVSHAALMPRTYQPVAAKENLGSGVPDLYTNSARQALDGGFFHFGAPLLIERDGQMNFRFRAVTPVLQYASSVDLTALNNPLLPANGSFYFDDRQSGVRNQAVRVTVSVLGSRFESVQDLLHAGALSR